MSGVYDGAFRTMVNDCKRMLLPLLNEVFDEEYAGDEQIELRPNEYFIDQQDEPDRQPLCTNTPTTVPVSVRKMMANPSETWYTGRKEYTRRMRVWELI